MIKIDLITGFLGSGKTTFIRHYAKYLLDTGVRLCLLENDFGAINVDRVLLQDLLGDNCGMEMIVGGDGLEAHQRRMRTKLIAMAMSGYERVVVEPSGIFDVDELFDLLYEDPIDRWYEMGNVLTVLDTGLSDTMTDEVDYLLASQCACAGRLILSRTQLFDVERQGAVIAHVNRAMEKIGSKRRFLLEQDVETADWESFSPADMERLSQSGFVRDSYVKQSVVEDGHFASLFCFYLELPEEALREKIDHIFHDPDCSGVFRIKGYMHTAQGRWIRINATREATEISSCDPAENVLIVIGENMDKTVLGQYLPVR
ncbi:MAG: GTP-binding protein [Lachnospiraceae bacterium]|nr:GTP-binding protein [Lachnospiraceae bacterium]